MNDMQLMKLAADSIRILSADAIQKAKSGHPGMPMGCADFAIALWQKHFRHNPKNPDWIGRDRFVLSAGHGSMLLYSLLHLYGYGITMDEIKDFRQWGSRTPGHPEYKQTPGVDVTTGPLGSGFASAVGMAIAQKYFASVSGLDQTDLLNGRIWVIAGDGCMMEGTTHEAASLAGTLQLDNVICFYDSNDISIEGSTSLTFTEDTAKRYEAYGWRVINCVNANDPVLVEEALQQAEQNDGRPTLIVGKTRIGFGSPNKEGKANSHGEPLGEDEVKSVKAVFGFDPEKSFYVPEEIYAMTAKRTEELVQSAAEWDCRFQKYLEANPEKSELISAMMSKTVPANLKELLLDVIKDETKQATRASSGAVMQKLQELMPALVGGSADLGPSNKTLIKGATSFSAVNRGGRNLHFGVREQAMSFIANGMALYGTILPYCATFFVFSDYMKPGIRLASLMRLPVIYVMTHDSFHVGEDGPTHEPIEHLTMLRSIPGVTVIRPAEAHEAASAWAYAAQNTDGPVALILTRQDLPCFSAEESCRIDVEKGAYVLDDEADFEAIIIATGSEVTLALGAAAELRKQGKKIRVVSMPSWELFEKQPQAYRDSVLPPSCKKRISVEAGSVFGWLRYTGDAGLNLGLDHFGASAPSKVLSEKFGFTVPSITERVLEYLG